MSRTYPGFPSPLERESDQLRKVVEYVAKVDAAAYNAFIDMRKALAEELDRSVDRLQTDMAESDDELRDHLRYVLAGSVSDRIKGAILLSAGIILATAGSVIGTVASC